MSHWEIQIDGAAQDLTLVQENLPGSIGKIVLNDDKFFLRATVFEEYDDAWEVMQSALKMVRLVNAALKLFEGGYCPIEISPGAVVRVDGQKRNQHILGNSASITIRSLRGKVLIDGVVQEDPRPRAAERVIDLAMMDKEVGEVLHYLSRDPDAFDLYKVLEFIRADLTPQGVEQEWRRISDAGCCALDDLKRCLDGLNRYDVIGYKARHSSAGLDPRTPNPMTFDEAKQLVLDVARKWLQDKL